MLFSPTVLINRIVYFILLQMSSSLLFMPMHQPLPRLRTYMTASGWNAIIIPCSDPHLSEYIPERWKCLAWVSAFTGSAGVGVVSAEFAGVWTDSRYFLQAEKQMKNSGFSLVKLKIANSPEYIDFLMETLPEKSTVAVVGNTIAMDLFIQIQTKLKSKNIQLVAVNDFWDELWNDRPAIPAAKIEEHGLIYAGKPRTEKIAEIRAQLSSRKCTSHLITTLDDIAWTLNLRGNDIPYNPVFLAYLYIDMKAVFLFTDKKKLTDGWIALLKNEGIHLKDYTEIHSFLSKIDSTSIILLDGRKVSIALHQALPEKSNVVNAVNPSIYLKAIKNETEIKQLKQTQIMDGISLLKFFYWLENTLGKEKITEKKIVDKLFEFRNIHDSFQEPSFASIVGYKEHAALPHYTPVPETDKELSNEGILLIDSGGQYEGGTTDITRTISLGEIKEEEQKDYTAVLKGLIALITTRFPENTVAASLDAIARRPIWDAGRHYMHGTGHGVGFFLNVHEGPQAFGPGGNYIPNAIMEAGMVTTIEPGIYHKGKYGIRIENMILTVRVEEDGDIPFLRFESLTLFPISTEFIDISMLTPQEINWLNNYHADVYRQLSPYLSKEESAWLRKKTEPVTNPVTTQSF